jgi:DUF4097 and DUF4098 domain-containing protein YvlB
MKMQFEDGRRAGAITGGPAIAAAIAVAMTGLLALLPGCTLESHYKYSETVMETRTLPVGGIDRVEVRMGSADIDVVTKEGPEAEFIIKRTYRASDEAYGKKLLSEAVVSIEREGSTLVVARKDGSRIKGDMLLKGYVSIEITATMPAGLALDILTGSGDLHIGDRTAAVKIHSGSGDVTVGSAGGGLEMRSGSGDVRLASARSRVEVSAGSGDIFMGKIEGETKASTGSGEISIENIIGGLSLGTGSGDITVAASSGKAIARTGSGEIEFRGHSGSAELTASSGDIGFGVAGAEGSVDLRTSSGDINVIFLGNESAELDITTMSGSITSKVPLVVKEATRRHLVGVAGDGRMELRIETNSGSVSVVRGSI